MSPQRIQLRRTKGYRKPEGAVVVSRPSKWGNPYRIVPSPLGGFMVCGNGQMISGADREMPRSEAAEVAVEKFRMLYRPGSIYARQAEIELGGRDLACWCPLVDSHGNAVPCHADVLLELANESPVRSVCVSAGRLSERTQR